MRVPDSIDPATGYRCWKVNLRTNRVESLNHHAVWIPYEVFAAECRVSGHTPEEVPVQDCTCGTYAAATFNRLFEMGYTKYGGLFSGEPGDTIIAGTVNIWGGIVPGTQGWRAQFAYPKRFLIPYAHARIAKRIAAEYGVPFRLFNTYRRH